MGLSGEREDYRVIVEHTDENKDDRTYEIKTTMAELPNAIGEVVAGLTYCDVTAYRLDEDGNRIGAPVYEDRIEDPYEEVRGLQSNTVPY